MLFPLCEQKQKGALGKIKSNVLRGRRSRGYLVSQKAYGKYIKQSTVR